VLNVKVHSAKLTDHEGIKTLLQRASEKFPRLSHSWLDAGSGERTRAMTGRRRGWDGVWSSSKAHESCPQQRRSKTLTRMRS
jgi:hypothetical protein